MSDLRDKLKIGMAALKLKKPEIIKFVNKKVNVPILNEKQEAKLLSDFFDKFMLALDKFSDKVK